jgi:signal transduction histidine kinase/CheY-like chemotaxis protein
MLRTDVSQLSGVPDDLDYLRDHALQILIALLAAGAYFWGFWTLEVVRTTADVPIAEVLSMGVFYGPILLGVSLVLTWALRRHSVLWACHMLVLGMLLSTTWAIIFYGLRTAPYLLTLVVMFAGLLLATKGGFVVATIASGIVAVLCRTVFGQPLSSPDVLCPIIVINLTGIASWLSSRNLYTALQWAWNSYAEASRLMERARNRQSELQSTLKALDEASYRIRSMNYTLTLAREQAEEARRLKQQFAANISHELRTPLNLIIGFSEMMFLSPESYGVELPRAYRGDVDAIYRSAQHLLNLVDDVLDLSQIEAGRMALLRERLNLKEVIEEATEIMDSFLRVKGLALQVEVPDGPLEVYADRTRIRQVLLNLLNNACRFTQEGGITVHAEVQDATAVVNVSDTGVGIPQERIGSIFEEFYPLEEGPTTRQGGRGLGLPLSKRFIELHGGRIWVESHAGQGSTFHFTLPLPSSSVETPPEETTSGVLTPFPVPVDKNVLVLNGDPAVIQLLKRHLDGYVVSQANSDTAHLSGESHPLAVVSAEAPDQSWDRTACDAPFLTCAALAEGWTQSALQADDYVVKPITRERLIAALDGLGEIHSVLVVDDNLQMVRLLSRMLRSQGRGYRVLRAYDGEEALTLMGREVPDVVLLDLMMPNMDGVELLQTMREREDLRDIRVIVISVRNYLEEVISTGEMIGVHKPQGFSAGELVDCMKAILDSLAPQYRAKSAAVPVQTTAPPG